MKDEARAVTVPPEVLENVLELREQLDSARAAGDDEQVRALSDRVRVLSATTLSMAQSALRRLERTRPMPRPGTRRRRRWPAPVSPPLPRGRRGLGRGGSLSDGRRAPPNPRSPEAARPRGGHRPWHHQLAGGGGRRGEAARLRGGRGRLAAPAVGGALRRRRGGGGGGAGPRRWPPPSPRAPSPR